MKKSTKKQNSGEITVTLSHSAEVRMTLKIRGAVLPLAQMGPGFVLLEKPATYPPGTVAEAFLSVDGHEDRWRVRLPDGIRPDSKRVKIEKA